MAADNVLRVAADKVGAGADRLALPKYIIFAIALGNFGVSIQANMLVNLIVRLFSVSPLYRALGPVHMLPQHPSVCVHDPVETMLRLNSEQVYFYLPPDNANLPSLVTEKTFLGIINAVAVILAFGRLTDSITDVLIANWSDRTVSKWGRRIPFMAVGMIPGAAATALMFVPPFPECAPLVEPCPGMPPSLPYMLTMHA